MVDDTPPWRLAGRFAIDRKTAKALVEAGHMTKAEFAAKFPRRSK